MINRDQFWTWFKNSEVLLYARIQTLVGAVSSVGLVVWYQLSQTDISPFFKDPRVVTGFIFANGLITEALRRRGTITHDGHLRDPEVVKALDPGDPGDAQEK